MSLQLFTKWYVKYVLFALCCVILLVVPLLKGPWIGSEPFLYFRLAQDPSWYDSLSNGGGFAAYSWGTALALYLAPSALIQILPFLLGILSFLLVKKIIQHYSQDSIFIHLSLLLFILSPAFIYTFSFSNGFLIAFFLSLAAFYFFTHKKIKFWSLPILLILPLLNIALTFSLLLILFFYSFLWKKERKKLFFALLFLGVLSSSIYYGYILYHTGIPHPIHFETQQSFALFQKIFFDLGSPYGLGMFISLLAIIGIAIFWSQKYTNLFIFFSIIFLFFFSFFIPESILFLSLFLIFFAAKGLIHLTTAEWTSIHYKRLITLIIISGLVFSAISQLNELIHAPPSEEILEGLQFLSEQKKGVVLTDYTRGVLINAAGQTNVLDENYLFIPDAEIRFEDSKEIFYSRNISKTIELFQKYDISYVWIDSEIKGKLWEYDTEGLLFILQYTKDFEKIYDTNGIEIWMVQ